MTNGPITRLRAAAEKRAELEDRVRTLAVGLRPGALDHAWDRDQIDVYTYELAARYRSEAGLPP